MLDRLSFRVVLRVVLLALATVAVLPVAFWSWQSWRSLDASARTLAAADASADAFRVLINIRTDRNTTPRVWAAPEPISPDMRTYMQKMAPRCLEWVVTISYWQPEVELSGDEIDHGFEVTG